MKVRNFIIVSTLHWLVSIASYFGLYGVAFGLQEAGSGSAWLVWLEFSVRYFLLQPFAHWVIDSAASSSWTWSGLGVSTMILALNSLIVTVLLAVLAVSLRPWWRRRRG